MMYLLLWLLALASALLLVATAAALSARLAMRWARMTGGVIGAAAPLLLGLLADLFAGAMLYAKVLPKWLFPYTMTWTIAYVAGAMFILLRSGLRTKTDPGEALPARSWPRDRLAAAFGIVLAAFCGTLWVMDLRVRTRMQTLHTESTAILLSLGPQWVPDEQNAAVPYQKAIETLTNKELRGWFGDRYLDSEEAGGDVETAEVADLLEKYEPALALVGEGTRRPHVYFGETYDQGFLTVIPADLMAHRNAANLLRVRARRRAKEGNIDGAFEDIKTIRTLAEHISRNPFLISEFISIALDDIGLRTLEDVLADCTEAPPEHLLVLAGKEEYIIGLAPRAMRCELAAGVQMYSKGVVEGTGFTVVDGRAASLGNPLACLWRVFMAEADMDNYRSRMHRIVSVLEKPLYESEAEREELTESVESGWGGLLAKIAVPNLLETQTSVAGALGLRRMAEIAVNATSYRRKYGKWPQKADDLVPEFIPSVPPDPFDGKPIRYLPADEGVVLYCVGRDGKDNGGAVQSSHRGGSREGDDIIFCLGEAYVKRVLEPSRLRIRELEERKAKRARSGDGQPRPIVRVPHRTPTASPVLP